MFLVATMATIVSISRNSLALSYARIEIAIIQSYKQKAGFLRFGIHSLVHYYTGDPRNNQKTLTPHAQVSNELVSPL